MFTRALRMQLAPIYPLIPLYFHANVRPGIKFPGRAARRQEESHIDSDVAIVSVFLGFQTCLAPCLYLYPAQHSHLFDQGAEPKNRSRANDFLSKLNCKPTSTSPPRPAGYEMQTEEGLKNVGWIMVPADICESSG